MIALLTAIKAKFAGDSQLPGLFPGGLWRNRAGRGTAMPYVVSDVASAPTQTYYGEKHYNDVAIRLTAYGTDHDTVGAAMETLDGKFNGTILTLASGTHINVYRAGEPVPVPQAMVDGSNNEIWAWTATYVFSTYN